ncbi:hypothetical protein V8J88_21395 [Massilia sp. W12]|uniref:hypothetical protein n=1 Tax=Massilia sp. W12 TaxID=3126507 RepID=UPI0030CF5EB5
MTGTLEDLGWPEAELFDMALEDGVFSFKMLDLLAYSDPLKYEVVLVMVKGIDSLHISMTQYRNGRFEAKFMPIQIGRQSEDDQGFEGVSLADPFTGAKAEQFWVSGSLRATDISLRRTGEFRFKQRAY